MAGVGRTRERIPRSVPQKGFLSPRPQEVERGHVYAKCFTYMMSSIPYYNLATVILILHIKKVRLRKVRWIAQSYQATKWWNRVSKPGLVPNLVFSPLSQGRAKQSKDGGRWATSCLGEPGEPLLWCFWVDKPTFLAWKSHGRRAEQLLRLDLASVLSDLLEAQAGEGRAITAKLLSLDLSTVHLPSPHKVRSLVTKARRVGEFLGQSAPPLPPGSRRKPLAPSQPWEAACLYLCLPITPPWYLPSFLIVDYNVLSIFFKKEVVGGRKEKE